MEELITIVRNILEMGWPAIVLIQLYVIWMDSRQQRKVDFEAYERITREYIDALREVAGLRTGTMPLPPRPPTLQRVEEA